MQHHPRIIQITLLSAIIVVLFCAPVTQLRPLKKGESTASLTLGGPFTQVLGLYIPFPLSSLGYSVGVIDSLLDIETRFHIVQALFGVLHIDLGCNVHPFIYEPWQTSLHITTKLSCATDLTIENSRVFPECCITIAWKPTLRWWGYTGLDNFFDLSTTRFDGNKQEYHWLAAPYLGLFHQREQWGYQAEIRFSVPQVKTDTKNPPNLGIYGHGAWGIFLGINYSFRSFKDGDNE
ncbi:MAG: hypothetical protein JW795_03110 [Chitinivibrionales bacterium]|nr:hypothetical protein [Chitinivibrionales bacterium]